MKTYSVNPKKERQVKVACNICGSESFKLLFKVDSAQFVKCTNCGLVYQNPQPVFEDLKFCIEKGVDVITSPPIVVYRETHGQGKNISRYRMCNWHAAGEYEK